MSRVCVVDDDSQIRAFLGTMLKSAGYEAVEVANAAAALELAAAMPLDVLVTDIVMPSTDGIELIREVKRLHPEVKIIAISGSSRYLDMAAGFGVDITFAKPFKAETFLDGVRALVQGPQDSIAAAPLGG